jgi:hypothetical protein
MNLYKTGDNISHNKLPSMGDIQNARNIFIENNISKTPLQKSMTFSEITRC